MLLLEEATGTVDYYQAHKPVGPRGNVGTSGEGEADHQGLLTRCGAVNTNCWQATAGEGLVAPWEKLAGTAWNKRLD